MALNVVHVTEGFFRKSLGFVTLSLTIKQDNIWKQIIYRCGSHTIIILFSRYFSISSTECHVANVLRVAHILQNYFTSLWMSLHIFDVREISEKLKKFYIENICKKWAWLGIQKWNRRMDQIYLKAKPN